MDDYGTDVGPLPDPVEGDALEPRAAAAEEAGDSRLLTEAVTALDRVRLTRFQVSHGDIGAQFVRSQFGYIFTSYAETPLEIVPLVPMKRRVQHNMRVIDASGRQLVFMTSGFCRRAHREYVRLLSRRLDEQLEEATGDKLPELGSTLIQSAFASRVQDHHDLGLSAVETLRTEVHGILSKIGEAIDALRERSNTEAFGDSDRLALAQLELAKETAVDLQWAITIRRDAYIPFVLLSEPLRPVAAPNTEEDTEENLGSSSCFLRHIVEGDARPPTDDRQVPVRSARSFFRAILRDMRILRRLAWTGPFWGRSTAFHDWPVETDLGSYHMLLRTVRGCFLTGDLVPENFEVSTWKRNHGAGTHASFSSRSIHLWRSSSMISGYADELLGRRLAAQSSPEPFYPEDFEGLRTRVGLRESMAPRVVFLVTLCFALLLSVLATFTLSSDPDAAADGPTSINTSTLVALGSATLTGSIAFINLSQDRPFSERQLPARVVYILVALALPPLASFLWLTGTLWIAFSLVAIVIWSILATRAVRNMEDRPRSLPESTRNR